MAQPSETPILPRSGTKSLPKGGVWGGVGLANDAAGGENAIRQRDMMHHGHRVSLPVIAVSTTAGTAAETTINYVITDEEKRR